MVRVFEIVGEVLGPAALDEVYVVARDERDIAETLWLDEFAGLRQRHVDWLDKLDAESPPLAWDPMRWSSGTDEIGGDRSDSQPCDGPSSGLHLDDDTLLAA